MLKSEYNFQDLIELMSTLRSENGCPWDRAQTHKSIKENLIEETYEVLSAIDADDTENLCEELGDVLLQVVFHTQMAKEAGKFDINDVITALCRKLIGRHAHVFGDKKAADAGEALLSWDEAKSKEKGKQDREGKTLAGVPSNMPAILRSYKIQKKAAKVGFDWSSPEEVLGKVLEEVEELREAYREGNENKVHEEAGDLIMSAVNAARFLGVHPEMALNSTTDKFIRRFEYIEQVAEKDGKNVKQMSAKEMDDLWNEAKKLEKDGEL